MTKDELADYFKVGFDNLHVFVDALPEGPLKEKFVARTNAFHEVANRYRDFCVARGEISIESGGDPNKDEPPAGP